MMERSIYSDQLAQIVSLAKFQRHRRRRRPSQASNGIAH